MEGMHDADWEGCQDEASQRLRPYRAVCWYWVHHLTQPTAYFEKDDLFQIAALRLHRLLVEEEARGAPPPSLALASAYVRRACQHGMRDYVWRFTPEVAYVRQEGDMAQSGDAGTAPMTDDWRMLGGDFSEFAGTWAKPSSLEDSIQRLPAQERLVIRHHYHNDEDLWTLATDMGLSRSMVYWIHNNALSLLRQELGLTPPSGQNSVERAALAEDVVGRIGVLHDAGLKQREIAETLGLTPLTVARYLRGERGRTLSPQAKGQQIRIQIKALAAEGTQVKEIATQVGLCERTVRRHLGDSLRPQKTPAPQRTRGKRSDKIRSDPTANQALRSLCGREVSI